MRLLLKFLSGLPLLRVLLSFSHTPASASRRHVDTHLNTAKAFKIVPKPLQAHYRKTKFVCVNACVHVCVCMCVFLCLYSSVCVCCFRSSVLIICPGLSSFIRRAVKWRDGGAGRGSGEGAEVVIGLFRSPGLAQGRCETNSGPGLSLFLPLSLVFSHPPLSHLPPPPSLFLSLPPSLILSSSWGLLSQ